MSDENGDLKYGSFGGQQSPRPARRKDFDDWGDEPVTETPQKETPAPYRPSSPPSGAEDHGRPDPFDPASGVEMLGDGEDDESELHLYKNFVCVVGKLHFKDTLKIRQGAFGDYAVFSLLIKVPARDKTRKYFLFIKAFEPRAVEWLKTQPNGTFIKIFGFLEAFNGAMYIKARDIFPVMNVDQVVNNVIGEPAKSDENLLKEMEYLKSRVRAFGGDDSDRLRIGDREVSSDWDGGLLALDETIEATDDADPEPETSPSPGGLEGLDERLRALAEQMERNASEGLRNVPGLDENGEDEDDLFLDDDDDDDEKDDLPDSVGGVQEEIKRDREQVQQIKENMRRLFNGEDGEDPGRIAKRQEHPDPDPGLIPPDEAPKETSSPPAPLPDPSGDGWDEDPGKKKKKGFQDDW